MQESAIYDKNDDKMGINYNDFAHKIPIYYEKIIPIVKQIPDILQMPVMEQMPARDQKRPAWP